MESKHRIELEVKLEPLDACYNTANDLTKQERASKILKTKVNFTFDRDAMVVFILEVAKKNN